MRKVVQKVLWQEAKRPMMRPERKKVAMVRAKAPVFRKDSLQEPTSTNGEARANPFPSNVNPHAKKIKRKRGERRPPKQVFC